MFIVSHLARHSILGVIGVGLTYRVAVSKAVHVGGVALVDAGEDGGLDGVEGVGRAGDIALSGGLSVGGNGEGASNEDGGETHGGGWLSSITNM